MKHLSLFLVAILLVGCRLAAGPEASTSPEASVPYDGVRPPTGPPIEPESNTRSITPAIESPEIGVEYDVYLSLHCGYASYWRLRFGGREWSFTENGSADSIFVVGTLRLVSADSATLTVDGTAHPLVPATDDDRCL
jgi:hypothetical protein